jgi:polyisoprenoid-binding protein YceI
MSAPTAITSHIPAGAWHVDPVHSTVGFAVKHMAVATFRGRFEDFDVSLTAADGEQPRLVGSVEVESLKVKDPNLAAHLTSPEFFDAERYPELRFESTGFRVQDGRLVVDGDLTVRGVTLPVEGRGELGDPLEDPYGKTHLGLSLTTVVDRTAFGLNWQASMPKGGKVLANDVRLEIELELVKEA